MELEAAEVVCGEDVVVVETTVTAISPPVTEEVIGNVTTAMTAVQDRPGMSMVSSELAARLSRSLCARRMEQVEPSRVVAAEDAAVVVVVVDMAKEMNVPEDASLIDTVEMLEESRPRRERVPAAVTGAPKLILPLFRKLSRLSRMRKLPLWKETQTLSLSSSWHLVTRRWGKVLLSPSRKRRRRKTMR
jgi:hypothetical protein